MSTNNLFYAKCTVREHFPFLRLVSMRKALFKRALIFGLDFIIKTTSLRLPKGLLSAAAPHAVKSGVGKAVLWLATACVGSVNGFIGENRVFRNKRHNLSHKRRT